MILKFSEWMEEYLKAMEAQDYERVAELLRELEYSKKI